MALVSLKLQEDSVTSFHKLSHLSHLSSIIPGSYPNDITDFKRRTTGHKYDEPI